MNTLRSVLFLGVIALLTVFCTNASAVEAPKADAKSHSANSSDPGVAQGETVFNNKCAKCHGARGAGTTSGPPLVHKIYHPNHHSDISFYLAVERGVRAHHWNFGNMEKVEGVGKEDTANIIKYIRGLQKEAGIF